MSYSNIPAGKDAPNDIYVIIEIPANAAPIKYEIDKDSDALFVDRFMGTAMFYPANYGYVPNTLSLNAEQATQIMDLQLCSLQLSSILLVLQHPHLPNHLTSPIYLVLSLYSVGRSVQFG